MVGKHLEAARYHSVLQSITLLLCEATPRSVIPSVGYSRGKLKCGAQLLGRPGTPTRRTPEEDESVEVKEPSGLGAHMRKIT